MSPYTHMVKAEENGISSYENIQSDWSEWKTTSCFKYLNYRVKKGETAKKWYIEFKNNYNQNISMSVTIKNGFGGDRSTIKSGETKKSYYFTDVEYASRIDFVVDKVKFNDTSWSGPYAECDY
ncbi:hypothetical protein DNG35_02150 [Mesonia sp. K7]|nr:hypothetical protein DNG35_02150 [Mesonia sp. K7]